jgi:hypothetical protein
LAVPGPSVVAEMIEEIQQFGLPLRVLTITKFPVLGR